MMPSTHLPLMRRHARCAVLLLLFAGMSCGAFAQPANALAWEITPYYGFIWRHTQKLTIPTGQPLWGEELGLRIQTRGRRPWHQWKRFPAFGVALVHFRLGEQAHGDAFGLLSNLLVPILRRGRWLATFRAGTGLGYVTHPYDYFGNPGQNAIGSHWNNFTQFRLGAEFRLSPHWRIQAGASLNHLSNGASTLPNFGINMPAGFAALNWSPGGIQEADFARPNADKHGGRRWGGILTGGLARVEYSVFGGPRYPVWSLSGAGYFHFNRVNRLHLGADYEFNRAVYEFGLRSASFRTKSAARQGATRVAVTLADEFLFGNLGVQVLAGVYAGAGINQLVAAPWYSKLSVRYYFPSLLHTPLRFMTGLSLKAHHTTASYISVHAGVAF